MKNNRPTQISNKKILTGTITPIQWDQSDRPIQFSLYTPDEEDIILEENYFAKKLKRYCGKSVEITGQLINTKHDIKKFRVTKIKRQRNENSNKLKTKLNILTEDSYIYKSDFIKSNYFAFGDELDCAI